MAHTNLSHIQGLVEKLWQVTCDAPHNLQVHEYLMELRRMAQRIQAVLNDAEKMEIKEEYLRGWLKDLKDVTYNAEDVLDEYNFEVLRAKVESSIQPDEATPNLPGKQKHHEISKSSITSIPLDASFCCEIADKIGKIRDRFEDISRQHVALHMREEGQMSSLVTPDRQSSSHIIDAPEICGRKDDLEKVIYGLLYSDECKKSNLLVLPVVGMGGVGKTTLVQHVYNDPKICEHFQMKGWVCISLDFTIEKLTERIIESLTQEPCDLKELSVLQEKLKKILDGKRFLLVLDNLWNENRELWESLWKPLKSGMKGSAVIITTRNESIAMIMKTVPIHFLNRLSLNDCFAVFIKSAFVDRDPDAHPDLIEKGKEIVRKCGGLPLAAKSLGGLLSYKNEADEWDEVLQSDMWNLPDQGDGVIPALRLSYLHLPSCLKRCFLYAAVFPKDFKFRKEELILLWWAQGFLQCRGSKQAEDFGNECFNELVRRSLFEYYPESNDEDLVFVMHDLFHDLAQLISGKEFFHMDRDEADILREVHHVSAIRQRVEVVEEMLHAPWANIRTVMVRATWEGQWKLPNQMMPHLRFLRALDLSNSYIDELPDSVGDLKHLRYLNLDGSGIERLPDSVCKLYNLQTLSLADCEFLTRLPKDIGNLCNLQRLNIEKTRFDLLPSGFGKLRSLHALDVFPVVHKRSLQVSNEEAGGMEVLKELNQLRGTLCITDLEYVMDAEDAWHADLRNKRGIRKLVLEWSTFGEGFRFEAASPQVQTQVLENLRPPDQLEVLKIIRGYNGLRLPSWMGGDPPSLSKLVRVELYWCEQCTTLPPLGQLPSLKQLEITWMSMVEAVGPEFRGHAIAGVAFPALEELTFGFMNRWVTWESAAVEGDFPRLRRLTIYECNKLELMIPLYLLPALEELVVFGCWELRSIHLWSGPSSRGPPPHLRSMIIVDCPRACFSLEDDQHLSLPDALHDLTIVDSPPMVEWCQGGRATSLAHIPNAKIWRTEDGEKAVSTLVPKVADGKLVLQYYFRGALGQSWDWEKQVFPQEDILGKPRKAPFKFSNKIIRQPMRLVKRVGRRKITLIKREFKRTADWLAKTAAVWLPDQARRTNFSIEDKKNVLRSKVGRAFKHQYILSSRKIESYRSDLIRLTQNLTIRG